MFRTSVSSGEASRGGPSAPDAIRPAPVVAILFPLSHLAAGSQCSRRVDLRCYPPSLRPKRGGRWALQMPELGTGPDTKIRNLWRKYRYRIVTSPNYLSPALICKNLQIRYLHAASHNIMG